MQRCTGRGDVIEQQNDFSVHQTVLRAERCTDVLAARGSAQAHLRTRVPDTLECVWLIRPIHQSRQRMCNQPGLIIASFAHSLFAQGNRDDDLSLPVQRVQKQGAIPGQCFGQAAILPILQMMKSRAQRFLENSTRPERVKRRSCGRTVRANSWLGLRFAANFANRFRRRGQLPPAGLTPALAEFATASTAGWKEQVYPAPQPMKQVIRQARAQAQFIRRRKCWIA